MKQLIFSMALIISLISVSQAQERDNKLNEEILKNQKLERYTFQLFPTQNMWTFIKLNTRNGQMWQVQYDVKDKNRFQNILNISPLVDKEEEKDGRFTLYPTQNIYTFILLDQFSGKVWQVQWSTEIKQRLVIPVE